MIFLWYTGGLVAAVAVGWVSAMLHVFDLAPVGIVSLGMGAFLGITLGTLAAASHITCYTRLIIGTVVMAIVTVLAEHAWLYCEFRRQWHEARASSAEAAMFRPETPWAPGEYFARELGAGRGPLWILDASLIALAAVAVLLIAPRYVGGMRVANDAAKLPEP
jgi:hypothetical protein